MSVSWTVRQAKLASHLSCLSRKTLFLTHSILFRSVPTHSHSQLSPEMSCHFVSVSLQQVRTCSRSRPPAPPPQSHPVTAVTTPLNGSDRPHPHTHTQRHRQRWGIRVQCVMSSGESPGPQTVSPVSPVSSSTVVLILTKRRVGRLHHLLCEWRWFNTWVETRPRADWSTWTDSNSSGKREPKVIWLPLRLCVCVCVCHGSICRASNVCSAGDQQTQSPDRKQQKTTPPGQGSLCCFTLTLLNGLWFLTF